MVIRLNITFLLVVLFLGLAGCVGEDERLAEQTFETEITVVEEKKLTVAAYRLQNKASQAWVKPQSCAKDKDESVSLVQVSKQNPDNCTVYEFIRSNLDNYYYLRNRATNGYFRPAGCGSAADETVDIRQIGSDALDACAQWGVDPIDNEEGFFRLKNRKNDTFVRALGCSRIEDESVVISQVSNTFTGDCTKWSLIDVTQELLNTAALDNDTQVSPMQGVIVYEPELTPEPILTPTAPQVTSTPIPIVVPTSTTEPTDTPVIPTPIPEPTIVIAPTLLPSCDRVEADFATVAYSVLESNCAGCHVGANPTGGDFRLKNGGDATDFTLFRNIASQFSGDESYMLLKPLAKLSHAGGQVFIEDDLDYQVLEDYVGDMFKCVDTSDAMPTSIPTLEPGTVPTKEPAAEPTMAPTPEPEVASKTSYSQLYKLTMALASRLPTNAEQSAVANAKTPAALTIELGKVADTLMSEEHFYTRLKEMFNDLLLTDSRIDSLAQPLQNYRTFLASNFDGKDSAIFTDSGEPLIELDSKGEPRKKDGKNIEATHQTLRGYKTGVYGMVREPLELIEYVVKNDKPFTEILTADYLMVNPYTANIYNANVGDANFLKSTDGDDFRPAKNIEINYFPVGTNAEQRKNLDNRVTAKLPLMGILSSVAFLDRYPTTGTNVNRARASKVFNYFLDTDVEELFSRDALDLDKQIGIVPTYEDPQCTACHDIIDPVAGLFQNRGSRGQYAPYTKQGTHWFDKRTRTPGANGIKLPDDVKLMASPGYTLNSQDVIADEKRSTALEFLVTRLANDDRFHMKMTKHAFESLTGVEPSPALISFLNKAKAEFVGSNYNFKTLLKFIVLSDYFRTANLNVSDAVNSDNVVKNLQDYGLARRITPEQLERKIEAIFGFKWGGTAGYTIRDLYTAQIIEKGQRGLSDPIYRIMYGGINSNSVVKREFSTNQIMAGLQSRIAQQVSCNFVAADLRGEGRLFPNVQVDTVPEQDSSNVASQLIRQNIQYLFKVLWAKEFELDHIEIDMAYQLFIDIRAQAGDTLPAACSGSRDTASTTDTYKTVKPWMAVITYMLLDYAFLYE